MFKTIYYATGCGSGYQCFRAKVANTTETGDGIVRLGYADRNYANPSFADGNTVAFTLKGVYFYLNNHLGTPAAITDSEGQAFVAIIERDLSMFWRHDSMVQLE